MSESAAVLAFARELFAGMGGVEARRMFGGAGLFAQGVMFGLIDDGVIYLKTDESLKSDLAGAGSHSWIYVERKGPKAGVEQETSYWSLPDSASDDPDEACAWGVRALAVALAKKTAGPKRRARAT
jgi:DNA transformation protein